MQVLPEVFLLLTHRLYHKHVAGQSSTSGPGDGVTIALLQPRPLHPRHTPQEQRLVTRREAETEGTASTKRVLGRQAYLWTSGVS